MRFAICSDMSAATMAHSGRAWRGVSRMAMAPPDERVRCAFRMTRGNQSNACARTDQCPERLER